MSYNPGSKILSVRLIEKLIEAYRSHPCLWNPKARDYSNKVIREKAYKILLKLCLTEYPNADIHFVKNRINSLRNAFRKEIRKMKASQLADDPSQVYVPKLWYFKLLTFTLLDEEELVSSFSFTEENCNFLEVKEDFESDQESNEDDAIQICLDTESPTAETSASSTADHLELPSQHGNESRDDSPQLARSFTATSNSKRSRNMGQEALIVNGDYNKKMRSNGERDECDVFAELIVKKLRRYNPVTRHIVQHHINTILFQADMGQYNDPSPYINYTSSAYCNQ